METKQENQLALMLSFPFLSLLILIGLVPIVFPLMSEYEGRIFPVVKNIKVEVIDKKENGIFINVSFDKVRACEFIGISWYDQFGNTIPIIFEASARGENGEIPRTRPALPGQKAGPWELIGLQSLQGSMAIVSHRCHPLWITYTHFYP